MNDAERVESTSGRAENAVRPMPRTRWELLSCAVRGHATYRPTDAPDLAERLTTTSPQGSAWRCLRCGDYILGEPRRAGAETQAPLVRRGAELRDAIIMRFLAVERFLRGIVLLAAAFGIWRFAGAKDSLQRTFDDYLPTLRAFADKLGVNLYDTLPVRVAERVFATEKNTLMLVVAAVAAYGLLEGLEGVGLWIMKRWGEYVAVVGTSLFLPYELYDIVEKVTVLRIITFLVNLAAVVWLVWSKRLFGFRGGAKAYEAERAGASILEVERAAVGDPT